jgi:LuxR family maltose regulon positive regulatory protein
MAVLDADDNAPGRFLTHLVAAFASMGLDVGSTVVDSMHAAAGAGLTALVNEITDAAQRSPEKRWVLALDDYHTVEAPEVHEAVAFLLAHLPPQMHLVVAARSDPALPLTQLRSRGQLTEVRAADLRFAGPEAQEFLTEVMDLDVIAAEVEALQDRTEGWVAGLQLAALSVRGVSDRRVVAEFVGAFTDSDRFVLDYLMEEVLARQPAGVRDLLLDTAVLDRLTGPLCDAVTGRVDGARMLENLERATLFVVPLDTRRCWYRYHHLFADV